MCDYFKYLLLCRRMRGVLRRLLVVAVLAAAMLSGARAQEQAAAPSKSEVTGSIVESGTRMPIEGVKITLLRAKAQPSDLLSAVGPKDVMEVVQTDHTGSFAFSRVGAGSYRLDVKKDGYVVVASQSSRLNFLLGETSSKLHLEIVLARPGDIFGRAIDADSRKPIAGLRIMTAGHRYMSGRPRLLPGFGSQVVTGADGRFVVRGASSGKFALRPMSRYVISEAMKFIPNTANTALRASTSFSADDAKDAGWDFEQFWYPGAVELSYVVPYELVTGNALDVGDLVVRRVPAYTVVVSVGGPGCAPGLAAHLDLMPVSDPTGPIASAGTVPCGTDVLIRGLPRGAYRIELQSIAPTRAQRARASVEFHVVASGERIVADLARGVDVCGRIVPAQGARRVSYENLQLYLRPVDWVNTYDEVWNPINDKGSFCIVNAAVREQRVEFSGLPKTHYVKEIVYNGSPANGPPATDWRVRLNPYATSHSLEIVVDDKPGAVAGTVSVSNRPTGKVRVCLVRMPLDGSNPHLSLKTAESDGQGRFRFDGLTPGEYKVFAVTASGWDAMQRPQGLERVVDGVKSMKIAPSGYQEIALDVLENQ